MDQKQLDILCNEIRETGSIPQSCTRIGITVRELTRLRKDSINVDENVADAVEFAADALEVEARRRAVDGVEEPVFYQGDEVATVTKFSDGLLRDLLKANNPEKFRERVDLNHSGNVSVVVNGYKDFKRSIKDQEEINDAQ